MRWSVLALVAIVPVVSGFRRGAPIPGFRLSEVLTVAVAGLVLVACGRRSLACLATLDWLACTYAVATLVLGSLDLLRRDAPFTSGNLSGLLGPVQYVVLYRAVSVVATTPDARRDVVRALLLASLPVAVLALFQSLNISQFVDLGVKLTGSDYRPVFDEQ